jgi:Ser-tRNA(Ala) deacylase AlaX
MKEIYPPMHTAEHLLNQTMIRLFGTKRCFSAHIEEKKSKCDYHFDRDLTEEEITQLEEKLNEIISQDLPVVEKFINYELAVKQFDLTRLPEGAGKDLRIIEIGDYDACPCIGPHVKSTKEIGKFKIISHDFKDGVLRIRYKLA